MAEGWGRLLRPPLGDDGLKIADSRELVELLDSTPIGDVPGVLIVGPLCRASSATTDVLLKTIEEVDPSRVRPIFWAITGADVSATVRSRCLMRWCPGEEPVDPASRESAKRALAACLDRDVAEVIESLKAVEPEPFLHALVHAILEHGVDGATDRIWVAARRLLRHREPTALELLAALLPEVS